MKNKKAKRISKPELLKAFISKLSDLDPFSVKQHGDEYESEALSILSRFNEASIQLSDDDQMTFEVSNAIVTEAFNFWFTDVENRNFEPVTRALITLYNEHMKLKVVKKITIGDSIET